MEHSETENNGNPSPLNSNLKLVYINSMILVVLMIAVSVLGILLQERVYQSDELSVVMVSNDVLNLLMGTAVMIICMLMTAKGKLAGLLCYPGALFYITYIYSTYLLGVPFGILFIPYLILTALSIYTIIGLVSSIDHEEVKQRLNGHVHLKATGIILFSLASAMIIYELYQITGALRDPAEADPMMTAQWITDFVVAAPPFMIIGFMMIRGRAYGYSLGISLLLVLSLLFIGLIPILIVKGILTDTPIEVVDLLVVAGASLICLIPFFRYARGINRSSR